VGVVALQEGTQLPALLHDTVPLVGAVHVEHAEPQALTLFGTHCPPQKFWPLGHWQLLFTHCLPPVHAYCVPQPPQLLLSDFSSTQAPEHGV